MGKGTVCLLHGLIRTRLSMSYLGAVLKSADWEVVNFGYPSRKRDISRHADDLCDFLCRHGLEGQPVSFVTHSLGSIIMRKLVQRHPQKFKYSRAVMLGPPNQGAEIARRLGMLPHVARIMGPSFVELQRLNLPDITALIEVGVIAGGTGKERGLLPLIKGDNDGVVTVAEATLPGAKEMRVVRALHSVLMYQPQIIKMTKNFLERGTFED